MAILTPAQFATDRLIIVTYPMAAGGKFLINCLSLSQQSVLQHRGLVKLDTMQKLNILCNRYNSTNVKWRDIGLGCSELFGQNRQIGDSSIQESVASRMLFHYHDIIPTLIDQGKYLFIVAHRDSDIPGALQLWPNARIIRLVNHRPFVMKYRWFFDNNPQRQLPLNKQIEIIKSWWKENRQHHWPTDPPYTVDEYQLPEYQKIAKDLKDLEPFMIEWQGAMGYQRGLWPNNCIATWDTAWYLDPDQCRHQLENLYSILGFDDFDSVKIQQIYSSWISALQRHLQYTRTLS